jgi:Xanthomonas XOO_2897-like deaminase
VEAGHGPSVITSTQNHPYYDLTWHTFRFARDLAVGDRLQTDDGTIALVAGRRDVAGSMVTYDLSIDQLPTYFVLAGSVPVLVHNFGCGVVTYGSDDLSRMAYEYRMANKIKPGQNVAIFEYDTGAGPGYIEAANIPNGAHSEKVLDDYIRKAGIDMKKVTRIYSERVPCSSAKAGCAGIVSVTNYPNATITSSLYGTAAQNYVALQRAMAYGIGG